MSEGREQNNYFQDQLIPYYLIPSLFYYGCLFYFVYFSQLSGFRTAKGTCLDLFAYFHNFFHF